MRDYERWHDQYDDPDSGLSWRLRTLQRWIIRHLDEHPGRCRVLSLCAGDGRDVIEVLAGRGDAGRVTATLVELHPGIAQRARDAATGAGITVDVRTADAGRVDSYHDAVPADLVLLVGIFGNISAEDLDRTIGLAPGLCRPGATLLWSRGRAVDDRNDVVRAAFGEAGFTELDYVTDDRAGLPAVGAVRYDGPPRPLAGDEQLFTFVR
jgi:SAM-dependent methyltransferase